MQSEPSELDEQKRIETRSEDSSRPSSRRTRSKVLINENIDRLRLENTDRLQFAGNLSELLLGQVAEGIEVAVGEDVVLPLHAAR